MTEAKIVEFTLRDGSDGDFWIDVDADRQPYTSIGPFATLAEARRALEDLMQTSRSAGGKDLPPRPQ